MDPAPAPSPPLAGIWPAEVCWASSNPRNTGLWDVFILSRFLMENEWNNNVSTAPDYVPWAWQLLEAACWRSNPELFWVKVGPMVALSLSTQPTWKGECDQKCCPETLLFSLLRRITLELPKERAFSFQHMSHQRLNNFSKSRTILTHSFLVLYLSVDDTLASPFYPSFPLSFSLSFMLKYA